MRFGVGEFVNARFAVPQNPVLLTHAASPISVGDLASCGMGGLGGGGGGCCGGCGEQCGCDSCRYPYESAYYSGVGGMGDISTTLNELGTKAGDWFKGITSGVNIDAIKANVTENWKMYALVGGGILVVMMLGSRGSSRSAYRREMSEAKRRVRAKYPTYARRVQRAVGAF